MSRRLGDVIHEVEALADDGVREVTLLGQNVNSYGRDLGAGQYRPRFADLLPRRRRRAAASAASASRPRTRRTCGPRRSRRWPSATPSASSSTCRSSRAATAPWPGCTAATPPSATSPSSTRPARAIPDLAVTTDIIVGFPGETDADFEATLAVVDAADFDAAYTFIFSPRPGTPAAERADDFVAPDVAQDRMRRLTAVVERHALAHHEARIGRVEEILVEGPSKRDPTRVERPHPARQARPRRRRPRPRRRPARSGADHRRRAALARRRAGPAIPVAAGLTRDDRPRPRSHLALVGPTASGKSTLAVAVARTLGDVEIVSLDSMQVYRDARRRDRQARRGDAGRRRRTTCSTSPTRTRNGRSLGRRRWRARPSPTSSARGRRALLVGGTGLYVQAVLDDLRLPGEDLERARRARGGDGRAGRRRPRL